MSRLWLTVSCFVLGMLFTASLFAQQQNVQRIPFMKDGLRDQVRQGDLKMDVGGPVPARLATDALVNNNTGATGTSFFTQSESDVLAFGNFVLIVFNDAGSNAGGANKFTGWSRSTDGGATFVDGGMLPVSTVSDAGDPVLARNETTGRIYFSTLGFNAPSNIQMFRSDDNGATWMAPVNATPGGGNEDKQWHTVDNFAGTGNGNVYLLTRNFGAGNGIFFYRSTNNGDTFGPSGGTLIVSGNQGAFIAVGPDHSVYAFWYASGSLQVRKSTDFGVTFGAAVTVASGLIGGTNGDLGLTGIRQGTTTPSGFRSNEFPHAAVNPITGNIYVTYNNRGAGADKCDIFLVQSTNGGAAWSAPVKINDDVTTTDQWQPTVAVTPGGNKIGIFYYSRQEDPTGNNLFKFYGRVGDISGAAISFPAPSFAISDVASLPEFGRDATVNGVYMGDYQHAYATATAFHVAWSDNRDDLAGGAPRKDPNMYYESILTTDNFGWAKGTITNVSGGAALSGVNVDFLETPNAPAISDPTGFYKAGVQVDTPAVTRLVSLRASKFGFRDTLISLTVTRNDTVTRDFAMTPAAGGTLSVYSHTATTNLRSFVEVKLGTLVVIADSTNGTTGLLTAPLPGGTYSVRVDAPPPNLTRNFPSVVITTGTTNVDALTQPVVTSNPAAMRDTLAVGQVHAKTLTLTNSTATDTVTYRLSDDNALAKMKFSKPAVQPNPIPVPAVVRPKGSPDPAPGQTDSSGGPDSYGYRWIDSDSPGGPVFNWFNIDTAGRGTAITFPSTDDGNTTVPMTLPIPFYGNSYSTSVNVCTNGWISFTSTSTAYSNTGIPDAAEPNNAIYGFWDDLNVTAGSVKYYYDAPNTRFIVQYTNVPYFSGTGSVSFQIMLYPNGQVIIQYLSITGTTTSATVGIENAAGTVALQVASSSPYIHNNLALKFYLPDAPWLSETPSFGRINPNSSLNITCTFDANGLTQGTTYNANITMDLTHPDVTGPIQIPASLRVIAGIVPTISVSPTTLTFPTTIIGATRRDSARVRNVGTGTLNISSVTTTNPRYAATITSVSLVDGDSARLRVAYTPVVPAGTDTGRVIILSNDPANPRVDVILTGTSVGAPLLAARIDTLVKPAMQSGTRDSIQFYVRNVGTASGNFAARAIMYPRTGPGEPVVIPLTVSQVIPINYPNDPIPPSVGFAPMGNRPAKPGNQEMPPAKLPEGLARVLVANAHGNDYRSLQWTNFDLTTPGTLNPLGPIVSADAVYAGDFTLDGTRFVAIKGATNQLIEINIANGSYTVIGPVTVDAGHTWTSAKFDPASGTFYATSTNITVSSLYTINITNGTTTRVATITNMPAIIGMAIQSGTGQMYGYDIVGDNFYGIDKVTGTGTLIGPIGFNANLAQDMAFDRQSGILYMAAYSTAFGQLRTVNLATGATTLIGQLGVGDHLIDPFSVQGSFGPSANWLEIAPTSGPIVLSDSVLFTARFDATSPVIFNDPGNYFGRIEINSVGSPAPDTLRLPVRMFVVPSAGADLFVSPDTLNIGDVQIGVTDSSKSVLVKNIGQATLNVTNVTFTGASGFSANLTSFSLVSLDTVRIKVRFAAAEPEGVRTARMNFTSNDPSPGSVGVRAVSFGVPLLADRIDSLVKPAMQSGTRDSIQFYVRNVGTASGNFAARAIMYPRSSPNGAAYDPLIIPMTVESVNLRASRTMASLPATGLAPRSERAAVPGEPSLQEVLTLVGERAFCASVNTGTSVGSVAKFNLTTPGTFVVLGSTGSIFSFAGDFGNDGVWYGISYTANNLVRIDTTTGAFTVIGPCLPVTGDTWTMLEVDPTTGIAYGTSANATNTNFYTINLTTGTATLIGVVAGAPAIISGGFSNTGVLYAVEQSLDNLVTINKTTGAATVIGAIGFDTRFAQDAAFDRTTNTLYLAAYNFTLSRGEFRTANLSTGATTLIGPFPASEEVTNLAIKGGGTPTADWLSLIPTSGPIALGDSVLFTARFDATSPVIFNDPGNYFGRVEINTVGAPVPDTLRLPARMFVVPSVGADLVVIPDTVDIGNVEIGVTDSSKSVLVKNIGQSTLNVTNVTFTGASGFSASRTNFSLVSLDTVRIKVRFSAVAPGGVRTARMNFTSNDPTPGSAGLRAVSVGVSHIVVAPDTFAYTLPASNDTTRSTFRIRNTGTDTLQYRIDEGLTSLTASVLRSQTQQQVISRAKGVENPNNGEGGIDGQGGPDAFGYRWIDSDEPGGPTYNWVEIRGVGTQISGLGDDTNLGPFPIGFSFPFYGNNYNQIRMCSNGFLSFTSTSTTFTNGAIPTTAEPNNALYPFWDDLNFTEPGGTAWYLYDAANNQFILQYDTVSHYLPATTPGRYTFQVILRPNGDIVYQYRKMEGTLNSATIGIENSGGTIALQVVFDAAYMHDNLAILLKKDLLPWMSTSLTNGAIAPGDSASVELRIHPAGLAGGAYNGRVIVTGNTPDIASVRVGLTITTLDVGENQPTIPTVFNLSQNYPNPFNPTTRIKYDLPEEATVSLRIYNLLGQEVLTLVNAVQQAGYYYPVWDGRNSAGQSVSSGVYFYRFEAIGQSGQTFSNLKKMLFLK